MNLDTRLERLSEIDVKKKKLTHYIDFGADYVKIEYGVYALPISAKLLLCKLNAMLSDYRTQLDHEAEELMKLDTQDNENNSQ